MAGSRRPFKLVVGRSTRSFSSEEAAVNALRRMGSADQRAAALYEQIDGRWLRFYPTSRTSVSSQ